MSDITLKEGQSGQAAGNLFFKNQKNINYPGINSCLSITLLGKHKSLAGAHAVAVTAGSGLPSLADLVKDLDKAMKADKREHLLIIGDTDTWLTSASILLSGFGSLRGIALELGMGDKYTVVNALPNEFTEHGIETVDILVSPHRWYKLTNTATGEHLKDGNW
jgi:hypothetical protein